MVTGSRNRLRDRVEAALSGFREDPESVGFHWRLNLSTLLCELLDDKGWTQKQLAEEAKMKEPVVSRLINADSNFKSDTAGRLLFALGVREGDIELRRKEKHTLQLTGAQSTGLSVKMIHQGLSTSSSANYAQPIGAAHG